MSGPSLETIGAGSFIALDLETTGLDRRRDALAHGVRTVDDAMRIQRP